MALPLRLVCWFLTALAGAAGLAMLYQCVVQARKERFNVRVAARKVELEVRMVTARKSSRQYPMMFAKTELRLERPDQPGSVWRTTVERSVTADDISTLRFLDDWQPGSIHPAALPAGGGPIEAEPPLAWEAIAGFAIMTWMLGAFAWLGWGAASDGPARPAMGWRFVPLAILPFGIMAAALIRVNLESSRESQKVRHPVEGHRRQVSNDQLLAELEQQGVAIKGRDQVKAQLGETLRYCEYTFNGRAWRSASLWCQPPEGEVARGRVNTADPRDVKWGEEP